jgi:hypothetical protein
VERLSEETFKYLKNLEGDCRINQHFILKINCLKAVLLALPFSLTFIGLIILYQYKELRAVLLFDKLPLIKRHQATHVLVKSSIGVTGICKLTKKRWKERDVSLFRF